MASKLLRILLFSRIPGDAERTLQELKQEMKMEGGNVGVRGDVVHTLEKFEHLRREKFYDLIAIRDPDYVDERPIEKVVLQ